MPNREDDPLWLAAEFHAMFPDADTEGKIDEEIGLDIIACRDELRRWYQERKSDADPPTA